jgi:anthranilate/para-aminobenzoate synthase component II
MPKKRIGLTQRVLYHKNRAYDSIEHSWYECLKEHTLFFIPNLENYDVDHLNLDALIITGGDEHPIRNAIEKKLITKFINEHKPILGICHGAFLLTQILNGEIQRIDQHMDTEHEIEYKNSKYIVNSFHTYCITQSPPRSKILAIDNDKYCEAWIKDKVSAIVWHPERMSLPFIPHEIQEVMFNDDQYSKSICNR